MLNWVLLLTAAVSPMDVDSIRPQQAFYDQVYTYYLNRLTREMFQAVAASTREEYVSDESTLLNQTAEADTNAHDQLEAAMQTLEVQIHELEETVTSLQSVALLESEEPDQPTIAAVSGAASKLLRQSRETQTTIQSMTDFPALERGISSLDRLSSRIGDELAYRSRASTDRPRSARLRGSLAHLVLETQAAGVAVNDQIQSIVRFLKEIDAFLSRSYSYASSTLDIRGELDRYYRDLESRRSTVESEVRKDLKNLGAVLNDPQGGRVVDTAILSTLSTERMTLEWPTSLAIDDRGRATFSAVEVMRHIAYSLESNDAFGILAVQIRAHCDVNWGGDHTPQFRQLVPYSRATPAEIQDSVLDQFNAYGELVVYKYYYLYRVIPSVPQNDSLIVNFDAAYERERAGAVRTTLNDATRLAEIYGRLSDAIRTRLTVNLVGVGFLEPVATNLPLNQPGRQQPSGKNRNNRIQVQIVKDRRQPIDRMKQLIKTGFYAAILKS